MTSTFGAYEVIELVATGSTGRVYRARHGELDRLAAVKELHPRLRQVPGFVERFRNEAAMLGRLDHPNVVSVYDYVEESERAWIAEEWVDGASLDAMLDAHGRVTPEQALGTMRGALMGLAYAHDSGLLHRDVAPGNILADRDGTSKLVDFGLAAPVGTGDASGTPAFISPEAARGDAVDKRSDVYSAAAVLYLLLSGRPPFPAADAASVLRRHIEDPPPVLTEHGHDLQVLVGRSLAKDPSERPADAAAFLGELEEAARRRFGADWLSRSSIAGLVAASASGAGMAASAVATGAPVVGTAAETVVIDTAQASTGGPAAPPVPQSAPAGQTEGRATSHRAQAARRAGRLSKLPVAVAAAAGVVVLAGTAGAVALVGLGSDDDAKPVASGTASATPSLEEPSFAELAPSGQYAVAITTVTSDFPEDPPGNVANFTWTFGESSCSETSCTGTISSSSGNSWTYTWDGVQLIRESSAPTVREGLCVDVETNEETPGSHFRGTTNLVTDPIVVVAAGGSSAAADAERTGPPERMRGSYRIRETFTELKNCDLAKPLTASYTFEMTRS